METRRTVTVKLAVDDRNAARLHETIEQFRWAANFVVQNAWQDERNPPPGRNSTNERTYTTVRKRTRLQAKAARNRAVVAIKSTLARWQQGKSAS